MVNLGLIVRVLFGIAGHAKNGNMKSLTNRKVDLKVPRKSIIIKGSKGGFELAINQRQGDSHT